MAKYDLQNRSKYWTDQDFQGISLLNADFRNLQFAPHIHEELVIAVTSGGAGKSITRHGSDITTPQQFLVYNPHESHKGGAIEGPGWRYRAFYIDSCAIAALSTALSHDKTAPTYFSRNCIVDRQLADFMLQAHATFEVSKDRFERQVLLLDAVSTLYSRYGEPRLKVKPPGSENKPLKTALDYMHENFSSNISVSELASVVRLSEFHFIRVFRKHYGLSPYTFLTQIRLKAARRMLQSGTASTETAAAVGFFDQSHLVRHFKRVYGITPNQFAAAVRGAGPAGRAAITNVVAQS